MGAPAVGTASPCAILPPPSSTTSVSMTFTETFLQETGRIIAAIDGGAVERLAEGLAGVRTRGGRLFVLGVGGSAGHAGHAVNDFRKICGIESYAPTDNVSELTARVNDEGWDTSFSAWLEGSRLRAEDGLLVFSVGGGDRERGISANIVNALELARAKGCFIGGVVGRDGGHTARVGDAVVVIPPLVDERITAHTEGLCAVIWHLLVSHPRLQQSATKWESAVGDAVGEPVG
jgi:D-sedoheptulose 7-phosphate isomerase